MKKCNFCNKEIEIIPSHFKTHKNRFCSHKCYSKWRSENLSGKNSPLYNKNIKDKDRQDKRLIIGYNDWRKSVYERDNYTCQKCNKYSEYLNAHHIESYANNKELRTTLSNGITLCENCHNDLHHQYGYNVTKEQLIEFINNR